MLDMNRIRDAVAEIAPKYGIVSVELFGSYADGTATESSDLDFLIDFGDQTASIFTLGSVIVDLEDALEIEVDALPLPLREGHTLEIGKVVQVFASESQPAKYSIFEQGA